MDFNPIKNILEKTGWSCDDLLKQLQLYKSLQNDETNESKENVVSSSQQSCEEPVDDISTNSNSSVIINNQQIEEKQNEIEITSNITDSSVGVEEILESEEISDSEESPESEQTSESEKDNLVEVEINSEIIITKETDEISNLESCKINETSSETSQNIDENDKSVVKSADSTEKIDTSANNDSENLRQFIKLQLNSLRNRKKEALIKPTIVEVKNDIILPKKKAIIEDKDNEISKKDGKANEKPSEDILISTSNEASINNKTDKNSIVVDNVNILSNEEFNNVESTLTTSFNENNVDDNTLSKSDELISQTNELGLVILNVQGGVEFDDTDAVVEPKNDEKENINVALDTLRKIIKKDKKSPVPNVVPEPRKKIKLTKTIAKNVLEIVNERGVDSINDNSPFLSNSLDKFLTENSELNISYKVPKLGAEDGLKKRDWRELSPNRFPANYQPSTSTDIKFPSKTIPKQFPDIKAKTLAEKRKLLETTILDNSPLIIPPNEEFEQEKSSSKPDDVKSIEKTPEKLDYKKKIYKTTVIDKKRFSKRNIEKRSFYKSPDDNDQLKMEPYKVFPLKSNRASFVKLDDKKVWLRKSCNPGCVAVIKDKSSSKPVTTPEKLSLLNTLNNRNKVKIKYKPGPLCKKSLKDCFDDWETSVKQLPKLYYEVVPEIGREIKHSHLLPVNEGVIDENQIEFALTALKSNVKVEPQKFCFPIKYANNQKNIIVRTKKPQTPSFDSIRAKTVDEDVQDVVSKLLDYVETKELTKDILKEDPICYEEENVTDECEESKTVAHKKRKRNKVDLELSRLSCKIVNVISNVEDEVLSDADGRQCAKSFCKFGCVCKSLACDKVNSDHCKQSECMFECSCPKSEQMVYCGKNLNICLNEDTLSTDAVSRIEFQVKKNLAKVEKEFTQTVIQANNKTIVVGGKPRRTTKLPSRYSDYVENFEQHDRPITKSLNSSNENLEESGCYIPLANFNLNDVVPFCLIHRIHNCRCLKIGSTIENKINVKITKSPVLPKQQNSIKDSPKEKFQKLEIIPKIKDVELKPVDKSLDKIKIKHTTSIPCARQIGVPESIIKRNKQPNYLKKLKKKDRSLEMSIFNVLEPKKSHNSVLSVDSDDLEIFQPRTGINSNDSRISHKRKQSFDNILEDQCPLARKNMKEFSTDFSLQRRKKITISQSLDTLHDTSNDSTVFEGETIIDNNETELLSTLGPKTWTGNARLLPWPNLLKLYMTRKINIWCLEDKPSRLLLNTVEKFPPKKYIDIMQSPVESELMQWIKQECLPEKYQNRSLAFILKPTKNHFEICGICTKTLDKSTPTIDKSITADINVKKPLEKYENLVSIFYHRDIVDKLQQLHLVRQVFDKLTLIQDIEKIGAYDAALLEPLDASLPTFQNIKYKWRLIDMEHNLKSDVFLRFSRTGYTIHLDVLEDLRNKAVKHGETFILQGNLPSNDIECKIYFGIYCTPCKRVFVGPYLKDALSDNLELFTPSLTSQNLERSIWLLPKPKSISPKPTTNFIKDDISKSGEILSNNQKQFLHMLKAFSKIQLMERNTILEEKDYNRYILTNIKHFGYIGARLNINNFSFDIAWPFERKTLRFESVAAAKEFLHNRFSILLLRIPETFKIEIRIVSKLLDTDEHKPVDVEYLNGHFICGTFGIHNGKNVSDVFCQHVLHMKKSELMEKFSQRANCFITYHVTKFGKLLNLIKDDKKLFSIPYILNSANDEILRIKKSIKDCTDEKTELLKRKKDLLANLNRLIEKLPPNEQKSQKIIMDGIIKEQQVIVLNDSDDEQGNNDDVKIGVQSKKEIPDVWKPRTILPRLKTEPKIVKITDSPNSNGRLNYKSILKCTKFQATFGTTKTISIVPPSVPVNEKKTTPPLMTNIKSNISCDNLDSKNVILAGGGTVPQTPRFSGFKLVKNKQAGTLVLLQYPNEDNSNNKVT